MRSVITLFIFVLSAALNVQAQSLSFSTFIGGSGDEHIRGVESDAQGNVYVTGYTDSTNFPTSTGAFQSVFAGGSKDAFVMKFSPTGGLLWSTLLGGPGSDLPIGIKVDSAGAVYMAAFAGPGFPTTAGVVQPNFGGDIAPNTFYGPLDGFVAKFSASGQLVWSTYFGGNDNYTTDVVDVDAAGNVYLAGQISAAGAASLHALHPLCPGVTSGLKDIVVVKLSPDASAVLYCRYIGGSADESGHPTVKVDAAGAAYVHSQTRSTDFPVTPNAAQPVLGGKADIVLVKLSPDGQSIDYATYFGGAEDEGSESHNLALDANGNIYIIGFTRSRDLLLTPPASPQNYGVFQSSFAGSGGTGGFHTGGDIFVAKLSPAQRGAAGSFSGGSLLASTYIGGTLGDGPQGIGVDGAGNVYLSGGSISGDFPTSANAFQSAKKAGEDIIAVTLSADFRTLLYGTYLGSAGLDEGRTLWADSDGKFYVAGFSSANDWPVTQGAFQGTHAGKNDAVLAKIAPSTIVPTPTSTATAQATSTATHTATRTATRTATSTGVPQATVTVTPTATRTATKTRTVTSVLEATPTPTYTPSATVTSSPVPSPTPTPTGTVGINESKLPYGRAKVRYRFRVPAAPDGEGRDSVSLVIKNIALKESDSLSLSLRKGTCVEGVGNSSVDIGSVERGVELKRTTPESSTLRSSEGARLGSFRANVRYSTIRRELRVRLSRGSAGTSPLLVWNPTDSRVLKLPADLVIRVLRGENVLEGQTTLLFKASSDYEEGSNFLISIGTSVGRVEQEGPSPIDPYCPLSGL